jgi:hypothetical protein
MPNIDLQSASTAGPALKIFVDQPVRPDGRPLGLGYQKYVDTLAAVVLNGVPARYTVGIYGSWGVGKSSILNALANKLESDDQPVAIFDAWRYARDPNVLVPLLHEVEDALATKKGLFWKSIGRGIRAITAGIGVPTPIPGVTLADVSNAVSGAAQAWREPAERRRAEVPHYRLKEIGDELSEEQRRIIVLIDDLDRCPPGTIVGILEAIHVLTDVQGFVFVMALDYEVLIDAIKDQYPSANAPEFIEKIIQIPFSIPEAERSAVVIDDVIAGWEGVIGLNSAEAETFKTVVHLALRTNPRQVKRLVNSMLVAQHIMGDVSEGQGDKSILLAVIGMQLRWPDAFKATYRALSWDPDSGFLSDYDLLNTLRGDDDLAEYMDAVLPETLTRDDVFAAMKYSQTTASNQSKADSGDDSGPESGDEFFTLGDEHMALFERIREQLVNLGAEAVARKQYIVFRLGSKVFLRVDSQARRQGLRLSYPDFMTPELADQPVFRGAPPRLGTNFARSLQVTEENESFAMQYAVRALEDAKKSLASGSAVERQAAAPE